MPAKTATRRQRRNLSTPTSELILDEYATLPQLAAEMRKSVRHFQRQAALRTRLQRQDAVGSPPDV